jgi:hypothetical protein
MKLILKISACMLLSWMLIFYSCRKEYSYEGGKNNKPPLAVAGPDTVITLPTDSVLLNGSKSSDPPIWRKYAVWLMCCGLVPC